jgi:Fe-S-cluster containining protein
MSTTDHTTTPAGDFSTWIEEMKHALHGRRAADVPCGDCTACCRSSQFIHIAPDETDTLAQIPGELLFPAPGLPPGHVLLGYDQRGHCPMFVDGCCSIYDQRPRTCQAYDCRIFAAAGLASDLREPLIARQAQRWRFSYTPAGRAQQAAIQRAATSLRDQGHGPTSPSTTELAVRAFQCAPDVCPRTADRSGTDGE